MFVKSQKYAIIIEIVIDYGFILRGGDDMENIILKKEHVDEILKKLKLGERYYLQKFYSEENEPSYLLEQVRRVRGGYLFTVFETQGDDTKRKYYYVKAKGFDGIIDLENNAVEYEKAVRLSVAVLKTNQKYSIWYFGFNWNYPPQKKFFCDFVDLLRGEIDFMCLGTDTRYAIESNYSVMSNVEALFRRDGKLYAYEADSLSIIELAPLDDALCRPNYLVD